MFDLDDLKEEGWDGFTRALYNGQEIEGAVFLQMFKVEFDDVIVDSTLDVEWVDDYYGPFESAYGGKISYFIVIRVDDKQLQVEGLVNVENPRNRCFENQVAKSVKLMRYPKAYWVDRSERYKVWEKLAEGVYSCPYCHFVMSHPECYCPYCGEPLWKDEG